MQSFVVRVYRAEKDNPRQLVGIVEEVGGDEKLAFTNIDDLWRILSSRVERYPGKDLNKKTERRKS